MADVLIIDDDDAVASAMVRLLQAEGHRASCAQTAGDALHRLREGPPDLVLLDLSMPRVGGLDLLEALGGEGRFAHIPVALFTGCDDPAARDAGRQLGARDYILKGQEWPQIKERIERCLSQPGA